MYPPTLERSIMMRKYAQQHHNATIIRAIITKHKLRLDKLDSWNEEYWFTSRAE